LVAESCYFAVVLLSVVVLLSPTCHVLLYPSRVTPVLGALQPPFSVLLVSVENYSGGDISSPGGIFIKKTQSRRFHWIIYLSIYIPILFFMSLTFVQQVCLP
jgi:hypothetical protein